MIAVRHLTILGSTGSIGVNTLDVVARHPDRFPFIALAANKNAKKMLEQCRRFQPRYAVLLEEASADWLRPKFARQGLLPKCSGVSSRWKKWHRCLTWISVMAAIVGAAGIRPTFAAARAGKQVLLANKETMVMAGRIFMDVVKENDATLLPIDSEHNAIFQSLPHHFNGDLHAVGVRRILLTASGGPFRQLR